jgi:hypothetical protein
VSKHKYRYTPLSYSIRLLSIIIRALATFQARLIMLDGKK